MSEIPLAGGDVNPVVRVGDTVRRPRGPEAVRALLEWYERVGFDGAPRFLGFDDRGREVLSTGAGWRASSLATALSGEEVADRASAREPDADPVPDFDLEDPHSNFEDFDREPEEVDEDDVTLRAPAGGRPDEDFLELAVDSPDCETTDQLAERALERQSPGPPVRVCPPARDQSGGASEAASPA